MSNEELEKSSNRKSALCREIDKGIHGQINLFRKTGQRQRGYRIPFDQIGVMRVTRKLRKELEHLSELYKTKFEIDEVISSVRFQIDLETIAMNTSQSTRYHEAVDFVNQNKEA